MDYGSRIEVLDDIVFLDISINKTLERSPHKRLRFGSKGSNHVQSNNPPRYGILIACRNHHFKLTIAIVYHIRYEAVKNVEECDQVCGLHVIL
jgi:hypothetical protein